MKSIFLHYCLILVVTNKSRHEDVDAGDDEEHHEGLRHAQQVLGVLALDARHDALPGARYEQVELGEG